MPTGPKGQKRPADEIGAAMMVGKIATGEIEDLPVEDGKNAAAVAHGWKDAGCRDNGQEAVGDRKKSGGFRAEKRS
jgi:hypothetical protein